MWYKPTFAGVLQITDLYILYAFIQSSTVSIRGVEVCSPLVGDLSKRGFECTRARGDTASQNIEVIERGWGPSLIELAAYF